MGICTVLGIRTIKYGFTKEIIQGDIVEDLLIGVSVFIIGATISEVRKQRKLHKE